MSTPRAAAAIILSVLLVTPSWAHAADAPTQEAPATTTPPTPRTVDPLPAPTQAAPSPAAEAASDDGGPAEGESDQPEPVEVGPVATEPAEPEPAEPKPDQSEESPKEPDPPVHTLATAMADALGVEPAIGIMAANQAPIAGDDSYTSHADEPQTIPAPGYLANDSDPDGDTFTTTVLDWPNHFATTSVNVGSGELYYYPQPGFVGTSYLLYQLTDSSGAKSNVATITFNIVNTAPVAVDNAYGATSGEPRIAPTPGVIGNDSDADGDFMEPVLVTGPAHAASFTLNTPVWGFTYVSEPGFVGTDTFTYQAKDEIGALSNVATVTINVGIPPNNAPPVAVDDSYTTHAGQALTINAPGFLGNDVDPDGDAVLIDGYDSSTITHGQLSQVVGDGSFTYVPDPGFTGTDFFSYQVQDIFGAQGTQAVVAITVTDPPPPPPAPDDPADPGDSSDDGALLPDTGATAPWWFLALGGALAIAGVLMLRRARTTIG